jgi:signal transduction histidine kinase
MLMSTSSEFVALCQEQLALLTQGLGASLSVVYLTQELVEAGTNETKLIPVVVYPDTGLVRQEGKNLVLPRLNQKLLTGVDNLSPSVESEYQEKSSTNVKNDYALNGDQIVLPLIHEDVMMGLLVTAREDREWSEQERREIQRVAQTLAIACILDRRRAWLAQQVHQQQILQEQQRDLLDNLLHQFRNPLTALKTFGKLLVKRLQPSDINQDVAKSIIRESDRLQELLIQFDKVIDLTVDDIPPRYAQAQTSGLSLPEVEVTLEASIPTEENKPVLLLPGSGEQQTSCLILDILAPLLESANAIALERNLELIVKIPQYLPPVTVNIKSLREVFSNILDNSLKYTKSGGKVLVEVGLEKANMQGIAISDTGPGIPPEDLSHIGQRHYRGVQAETEIPGTGLGISIAKQLIEQMQGKIEIFSPALNSRITTLEKPGCTFIIWLLIANC